MGNDKEKALAKRGESKVMTTSYSSFDLEVLEEVANQLPQGGGSFFKCSEGKNYIRFVPPRPGEPAIKMYHKHHFSMGGERKQVICPKYQSNQPCAVCAAGQELRASTSAKDRALARGYEPQTQVYVNIVDRKNPEKGVQVFAIPGGLWKRIRSAVDLADLPKGVLADPENGYDIVIVRTGTGPTDTKYDPVQVARKSTPLPNAEEYIANQRNLEEVESLPSDEEMDTAVDGEYEAKGGKSGGKGGKRSASASGGNRGNAANAEEPEDAEISYDD